ncbi:MAG: METTL5 family protein [Halobaculum sp.]
MRKRAVERRLARTESFRDPSLALEQYPTPPDVAAQLLHLAAMRGDLAGTVVDLGTGTGRLALAAACHEPRFVVALDVDGGALRVARENEARVEPPTRVDWVCGDVTRLPATRRSLSSGGGGEGDAGRVSGEADVTVVANPPFGAQDGREGADRAFLAAAAETADVSYTLHNAGSRSFVESFAADEGGRVTDAFGVELAVDNAFDHQTAARRVIDAEAYRIEW